MRLQLQCTRCRLFPVKRGLIDGERVSSVNPVNTEPGRVRVVNIVGGVDPRELEIC